MNWKLRVYREDIYWERKNFLSSICCLVFSRLFNGNKKKQKQNNKKIYTYYKHRSTVILKKKKQIHRNCVNKVCKYNYHWINVYIYYWKLLRLSFVFFCFLLQSGILLRKSFSFFFFFSDATNIHIINKHWELTCIINVRCFL